MKSERWTIIIARWIIHRDYSIINPNDMARQQRKWIKLLSWLLYSSDHQFYITIPKENYQNPRQTMYKLMLVPNKHEIPFELILNSRKPLPLKWMPYTEPNSKMEPSIEFKY